MSSSDTEPTDGINEAEFDLMDWIESGTVARRQVVIHNNPALADQFAELEAQLAAAEKNTKDAGADGPLSEADPREEILADMEALWEKWEASKAVWTVRAVSQDDVEASFDEERGGVHAPKAPMPPPEKAGERARERFMGAVHLFNVAKAKADRDRKLCIISTAVVSVETPRGIATSVSVEQLRALRDRPHGEQWIDKLYAGVNAATAGDVEIPRPTSPERSTSSQA